MRESQILVVFIAEVVMQHPLEEVLQWIVGRHADVDMCSVEWSMAPCERSITTTYITTHKLQRISPPVLTNTLSANDCGRNEINLNDSSHSILLI